MIMYICPVCGKGVFFLTDKKIFCGNMQCNFEMMTDDLCNGNCPLEVLQAGQDLDGIL